MEGGESTPPVLDDPFPPPVGAALRPLVLCGQQSLEIFCIGILLSALGHFVLGEYSDRIPIQLAVNAVGIAIMILTARLIDWYKRMDRLPLLRPALARGHREESAE